MSTVRVIPWPRTGVRGRSARRKAFYDRSRTARHLPRLIDGLAPAHYPLEQALLDVISGHAFSSALTRARQG